MTNQPLRRPLAEALDRLAAPLEEQIDYLTALGVADLVDELALEFDDAYLPLKVVLEQHSHELTAACAALDRALSDPELGWTFADLSTSSWEAIRGIAAAAANHLRRDEESPA